ncbi:hypothetical protein RCL1_004501 [Eukaryota sp. TZLM3-RCL]
MTTVIATIRDANYDQVLNDPVVTAFRINVSHSTPSQVVEIVTNFSKASVNKPLFLDLKGAKLRISKQQPKFDLTSQSIVPIIHSSAISSTTAPFIALDDREYDVVKSQTHDFSISIDDGKIQADLKVHDLTAIITRGGLTRPSKGLNMYPHPGNITSLSPEDIEIVQLTAHFPFVAYALSFCRSASDIFYLKSLAPKNIIAAKIELPVELPALTELLDVCDQLWLCRGDLGANMGLLPMSRYYKQFKQFAFDNSSLKRKFILAGEVLEHMTIHPIPTRSEVCHLADALDWADGIVLSNEIVVGQCVENIVDFLKEFLV